MPTKLPAHTWRRPRNARNWTTGASFRDHTTCECLLGHLYGAVPSALSSLELDPRKQTPGRLSARSRGSTHKVRHRPPPSSTRSRRRACPPPRRHQTRIFQAPSAARRPRTRPLRPVEHRNPHRSATELQRCPLQNRVPPSRRALQGGPEACDHCEMARSNRPGLPPEANRPPGSATVVDPGAAGHSATCAASAAAPGPQTPPGGPQGRYRERKGGTHRNISTAARWGPAADAGVRHRLDQFFILRKTT